MKVIEKAEDRVYSGKRRFSAAFHSEDDQWKICYSGGNMAKKSSATAKAGSSESSEFNMAEEIRSLLKTNRNMSTRDIINAIREKFPKQTINENSCSVAVVYARRKMGITVVRKRRPVAAPGKKTAWSASRPAAATAKVSASGAPGIELLVAAKELLKRCGGDESAALSAIRQVAALQM